MAARTQELGIGPTELLGESWHATRPGAPVDIDQLRYHIITLESNNEPPTATSRLAD